MSTFKYVFIPSDGKYPCEEMVMTIPKKKDDEIACLTSHLRQHFKRNTGNVEESIQKEEFRKQIVKQIPKGTNVTDDMINSILQMDSLVDSVPLLLNSPTVKYVGVNMYVDDRGVAKNLPTNMRASAIAQACGKMIEVKGDAFIARVFDDDDGFSRLDFTLNDLDSNAEWMKKAREINTKPSQSNLSPPQNQCNGPACSSEGGFSCSRCKQAKYCSVSCQKAHWKKHKLDCKSA